MDKWSKYGSCKTRNKNIADYYESVNHCHSLTLKQVLGGRVEQALDIACGDGDSSRIVSRYSEYVIGVDSSETLIKKAKQKLCHNRFQFECNTFEDIEFEAGRFDLISSSWYLNHVHTTEGLHQAFLKMDSLLKPDGKVVFIVPSASFTSPEIQQIAREEYGWHKAWTEVQETLTRGVFCYGDHWIPTTVWQPMFLMKMMSEKFHVRALDVKSTLINEQRLGSLQTEPPFEIIYGEKRKERVL